MTNEKNSLWMAARIARSLTGKSRITPVLGPLVAVHRRYHPKADIDILNRAYTTAERLHAGVMRKSGSPTSPTIAGGHHRAETAWTHLVAALLHDTVEDADYPRRPHQRLRPGVALLVDGVTKLDKVDFGEAAEAETIRKMIIAMAHDPRVLVIKVADRLHNMRTMRFLPPEKQAKKARETLEVIAPLAHRLGMATIKWELEDLAFAILEPKKYQEIVRLVADRAPSRDVYLGTVTGRVNAELEGPHQATVEGAPSTTGRSIEIIVRGPEFDEIDLVGIRCKEDVRTVMRRRGCTRLKPMPGHFKDYIAQPRFGVYRSAHHCDRPRRQTARSRSAPMRCTAMPSTASRPIGDTRRPRANTTVPRPRWMRWRGCGSC